MATDFLQAAGTNGYLNSGTVALSSEIVSLADATSAISTAGGTSGVFTQSDYDSAIWAEIYLALGGSFTPGSGSPDLLGWFVFSPDGSFFEKTVANTDLPRNPDFIIPAIGSNAYASGDYLKASGLVRLPAGPHKYFVMNHMGATLPGSGTAIITMPTAIQY